MARRVTKSFLSVFFIAALALFSNQLMASPVLVDVEWLAKKLSDPAEAKKLRIIDMTSDDMHYVAYHIPGAVRLPYQAIVTRRKDKVSVRLPDWQLGKVLGQLGVTADQHVIIYDDIGGLHAGRLFWDLERIGHPKVSVLDGGIVNWILAGKKVVNTTTKIIPSAYQIDPAKTARSNEASLADIEAVLKGDSKSVLLDVRTQDEFVGSPKFPRSGHIPGARWWPWDQSVDFKQGFTLKDNKTLKQSLNGLSDNKNTPVVLYCRSGHRAAQSYLTLRNLGMQSVKIYDASMAEYGNIKALPLLKGKK